MPLEITIGVPSTRFVIVHYHILKNGGSTIESILRREFGHAFATVHGPRASSTLGGRELAGFLRDHPHTSAISSHHLRYPKPFLRNIVVFDCCFLRHPLDRLHSFYNHLRHTDSTDPLCLRARELSPRAFMQRLVAESPNFASEVHVTQLARSGAYTRPAHPSDLEKATRVLNEMAIPGLVEMFDESLVAAEYFLRPAFPELSLEFVPQNVRRSPAMTITEREKELADLWGVTLYDEVARLNQLDFELYRRAERELKRRLALIPKFQERLQNFTARCNRLKMVTGATA
jgi:hypothetical protein